MQSRGYDVHKEHPAVRIGPGDTNANAETDGDAYAETDSYPDPDTNTAAYADADPGGNADAGSNTGACCGNGFPDGRTGYPGTGSDRNTGGYEDYGTRRIYGDSGPG